MRERLANRRPVFFTTLLALFCLCAVTMGAYGVYASGQSPILTTLQQGPPRQGQSRPVPPATTRKNPNMRQPIPSQARNEARKAVQAVGLVTVRNTGQAGEGRPRGSAVVISRDGLVVTNYHVIVQDKVDRLFDEIYLSLTDASSTTSAASSIRKYRLKGLVMNREQDLALLRIVGSVGSGMSGTSSALPANFYALEIGDARRLRLLDDLVIIGYPEKGGTTVTVGTGTVQGKDNVEHWIKTDAQLIRGNSGGAAINAAGKLVGIPTKVIFDTVRVDKDGDGFPDEEKQIGAVGYLRPAYLIEALVGRLQNPERNPPDRGSFQSVTLRGVIRSITGRPIAGASVGLVPVGTTVVEADKLLAWGGTNADGKFELNKSVPAGRYTLKVKAVGYEAYSREVELAASTAQISVELRATR